MCTCARYCYNIDRQERQLLAISEALLNGMGLKPNNESQSKYYEYVYCQISSSEYLWKNTYIGEK